MTGVTPAGKPKKLTDEELRSLPSSVIETMITKLTLQHDANNASDISRLRHFRRAAKNREAAAASRARTIANQNAMRTELLSAKREIQSLRERNAQLERLLNIGKEKQQEKTQQHRQEELPQGSLYMPDQFKAAFSVPSISDPICYSLLL